MDPLVSSLQGIAVARYRVLDLVVPNVRGVTSEAIERGRAGAGPFARFVDQWAVRLTTYRRDGTAVGTPVNLAVDGDRAYFRTYEETWKFKRLQRDPEVMIAPSTFRGAATGPGMRAQARLLDGREDAHAAARIDAKHRLFQGVLVRLAHRLFRYHTRHFEVTALPGHRFGR